MIVCNSTVLIYLSKIGNLSLLKKLFSQIIIPESVKKEVVDEGKKRNYIDAVEVEKATHEKWIIVERVDREELMKNIGIHHGEADAISLAFQRKLEILLDQTHAREAALLLQLKPHGTLYVLFLALKKGLITYDSYLECLLKLVQVGFRMSEEVYIEAIRLGKELSSNRK